MSGETAIRPLIQLVGDQAASCDPESDFCDVPAAAIEAVPETASATPAAR